MEGAQLAQIFADQGIAPGYMRGEKQGTDLASTIARTKQQGLESDRYAASTPDYLKQQGYETEKARLGNLQGQADEAAGANTAKAQLEARKAQEAFKTLPLETQQKMRTMTIQKSHDLLNIMEQAISTSGSTQAGIEAVTTAYPDIVSDKGWQAAIKQYQGLSPEQVLAKVKQTRHGLASSNAYSDPGTQGKMIQENQDQSGRMDLANLNNAARLREAELQTDSNERSAGIRAANSGGSTNATEAMLAIMDQMDAAAAAGDTATVEKLQWRLNQLNKASTTTESGLLGPKTKEKTGQDYPGLRPKVTVDPTLRAYLGKASSQEDFARRVKELRAKGWTKEQIQAANGE